MTVPARPSYYVTALPLGNLLGFSCPEFSYFFQCEVGGGRLFSFHRNLISYSEKVLREISAIRSLFRVIGWEMEGWEVEG